MDTCRVKTCDKPGQRKARGMCWGHYRRFLRYGHPLGQPTRGLDTMWRKVAKREVGCWHYDTKTRDRPPRFTDAEGRRRYVKDLVWEELVGPLNGARLRPLCGTFHCVRPEHFQPVNSQVA